MTFVIFYLCLSAAAIVLGLGIGRWTENGGTLAIMENHFFASLLAVVIGMSFIGGLIGVIAMTNYTDLNFWMAVGLFAVVQGPVFFVTNLLLPKRAAAS